MALTPSLYVRRVLEALRLDPGELSLDDERDALSQIFHAVHLRRERMHREIMTRIGQLGG